MSKSRKRKYWKMPEPVLRGPMKVLQHIDSETDPEDVLEEVSPLVERILEKSRSILSEEAKLAKGKAKSSKKPPSAFLCEYVYQLVVHLLVVHQVVALQPLFPDEPRRRRGVPSLLENPFYWVLLHLLARGNDGMSERLILRTANILLHAHRHQIPPYLLSGFTQQIKDRGRINGKVANWEFEPWHPEYRKPESLGIITTETNAKKSRRHGPVAGQRDSTRADEDDDSPASPDRTLH